METMHKGLVIETLCIKEKEGSIQKEEKRKKKVYCFVNSTLGR
jgi:hypothetical protein